MTYQVGTERPRQNEMSFRKRIYDIGKWFQEQSSPFLSPIRTSRIAGDRRARDSKKLMSFRRFSLHNIRFVLETI